MSQVWSRFSSAHKQDTGAKHEGVSSGYPVDEVPNVGHWHLSFRAAAEPGTVPPTTHLTRQTPCSPDVLCLAHVHRHVAVETHEGHAQVGTERGVHARLVEEPGVH